MRRNLSWILGAIFFIAFFSVFESLAFIHPDKYNTLSSFVASIGAFWPFAIYLFGFLNGGLAVHFFWPWAANPMGKGGG